MGKKIADSAESVGKAAVESSKTVGGALIASSQNFGQSLESSTSKIEQAASHLEHMQVSHNVVHTIDQNTAQTIETSAKIAGGVVAVGLGIKATEMVVKAAYKQRNDAKKEKELEEDMEVLKNLCTTDYTLALALQERGKFQSSATLAIGRMEQRYGESTAELYRRCYKKQFFEKRK